MYDKELIKLTGLTGNAELDNDFRNCSHCPHVQFDKGLGKYGQEYYCDVDNAYVTDQVIYDSKRPCPLAKHKTTTKEN